ncbi:H(+)-transporting V1 sector ATPase subunit A [Puccinia graminis f. sp. tritici]|nr:H(+)-transporting V1 sector ATPase subunit A [Puccinia graminis f. sp. tritici]
MSVLQPWYAKTEPEFVNFRSKAKDVLQKEDELAEIVQLVGKSALGEGDKVTLDVARLIKDDYLQQNGMSSYDRYCPFYKTNAMLKNLMTYYTCAQKAVESNVGGKNLTWAKVRDATSDEWYRLSQMKFEDPKDGEETLLKRFHQLCDDITKKFESLAD